MHSLLRSLRTHLGGIGNGTSEQGRKLAHQLFEYGGILVADRDLEHQLRQYIREDLIGSAAIADRLAAEGAHPADQREADSVADRP